MLLTCHLFLLCPLQLLILMTSAILLRSLVHLSLGFVVSAFAPEAFLYMYLQPFHYLNACLVFALAVHSSALHLLLYMEIVSMLMVVSQLTASGEDGEYGMVSLFHYIWDIQLRTA